MPAPGEHLPVSRVSFGWAAVENQTIFAKIRMDTGGKITALEELCFSSFRGSLFVRN